MAEPSSLNEWKPTILNIRKDVIASSSSVKRKGPSPEDTYPGARKQSPPRLDETTWMDGKASCRAKEVRCQRVHTVHFHKVLEHGELIYGDRNQTLGCL